MSGGAFDYLSTKLEDAAEGARRGAYALELLAAIEHEVDWGYSGDTCRACAELRAVAALVHYFSDGGYGIEAAVAVVRDRQQNLCPRDAERLAAR